MADRKAWVDFGDGNYDGLKELMCRGFLEYWRDGVGVGSQNKAPVVFAVRMVSEDELFSKEYQFKEIQAASLDFYDENKPQPLVMATTVATTDQTGADQTPEGELEKDPKEPGENRGA